MTVEVRRNTNGTIDEIVSERCSVHVEQMDTARWFMSIETPDGTQWRFWLGAKNSRSAVVMRHDETIPPRS